MIYVKVLRPTSSEKLVKRILVNGDAEESFRSICGERRACPCSITKVLAIYIHLRQTLIGQPAITSVAAGVAVLQDLFHNR